MNQQYSILPHLKKNRTINTWYLYQNIPRYWDGIKLLQQTQTIHISPSILTPKIPIKSKSQKKEIQHTPINKIATSPKPIEKIPLKYKINNEHTTKLVDDDGTIREGQFKDGKLNGNGKISYTNGNIFEGQFKNGYLNGNGKISYTSGNIYEGQFKDGKLNGFGKISYTNGNIYEGQFQDGQLNGNGKISYTNGNIFEGQFQDGHLNGNGKISHNNGNIYEGQFQNGQLNGYGKIVYKNGPIVEGPFQDNKLNCNNQLQDSCKISFNNGDIYIGQILNTPIKHNHTHTKLDKYQTLYLIDQELLINIYLGIEIATGKPVIIKIEPKTIKQSQLQDEYEYLNILDVSNKYSLFENNEYNIMIMPYLGSNLETYQISLPKQLPNGDWKPFKILPSNQEIIPNIKGNTIGLYRISHLIGHGSFGQVYLGSEIATSMPVAIKVEPIDKHHQLLNEYQLLKDLNCDNSPKVYWSGSMNGYNIMVMQYLGQNLETIFENNKRKLDVSDIKFFARSMLTAIKCLHQNGLIHRDIKPENFVMNNKELYLIDYGLAKRYLDANNKHIQFTNSPVVGTRRYMSHNMHDRISLSRRDDLESIGYVIIYLFKGKLPWQGLDETNAYEAFNKVGQMKTHMSLEELCSETIPEMLNYMKYVRSLLFKQTPDYEQLIKWFS